jgi:hypothetical protein
MDNNRVITLANLKQWLENEPNFTIDQWKELLKIANNVCMITIDEHDDAAEDVVVATGFHMGNGWIMTNYHNIFEETFQVDKATFDFGDFKIQRKKRSFICPDFRNANPDVTESSRKDLALIFIEEGIPQLKTGLHGINVFADAPQKDDPVCLIHFGTSETTDPFPMQFSVGIITDSDGYRDKARTNRLIRHNAYCPPGSSGGPLLVFKDGSWTVCAVHHAGTDDNTSGAALLHKGDNWIQSTVNAATSAMQISSGGLTISWLEERNVQFTRNNIRLFLNREVTKLPEEHKLNLSNVEII